MAEITDPDVLKQFNAQPSSAPSGLVTDPEILKHFDVVKSAPAATAGHDMPDIGAPLIPSGPKWEGNATANDMANSAASAAVKGIATGIGTPGDISNLLAKGSKIAGDYIADKFGAEKSPEPAPSMLPTSSDVKNAIEGARGKLYVPQTPAGQYTGAAVETATNPFSYLGPGSTLAKAATAAGAGLGSEGASQFADYEKMTPLAKSLAPLVGAIAGGHVATGIPRITPIIPAERQASLDTLDREGITAITAGQRRGSSKLLNTESVVADQPWTGHSAEEINSRAADQFTGAALRRIGEDAPRATSEVVDRAFNRIGNQFETIGARNYMRPDNQLAQDLQASRDEYHNLVGPQSRAPVVDNTISDIADQIQRSGGVLNGDQYNAMTSRLARQARNAKNDPQLQDTLHGLRESLDDAFERTLQSNGNIQDLNALQQARRQYRNLMVIERAANSGGAENVGRGIITPSALFTATKGALGLRSAARGQDDFGQLAKAGMHILTPLPQSGTAPRMNIIHHMQLAGLLGAEGGGGAAYMGASPLTMAVAAIGGLAAPAIIGRAVMSPLGQRILGNQALPFRVGTSPSTIALANEIRGQPQTKKKETAAIRAQ